MMRLLDFSKILLGLIIVVITCPSNAVEIPKSMDPISALKEMFKMPQDDLIGRQWALRDIMADKAWTWAGAVGKRKMIVAVIDTGIKYDHEDLQDNMWINEAEANGVRGYDDDQNGYTDDIYGYNFVNDTGDPMDDNGHGTHCAGIVGAVANNKVGIVGVNWNVRLMAVKSLDQDMRSETAESLAKGIDYAVKNHADVISASWGGEDDEILRAAIERAEAAGVLVVAAAGNLMTNNDEYPFFPGSYRKSNVISVTALTEAGEIWMAPGGGGSSTGRLTVDVAAPGVNILSTFIGAEGYKLVTGTSQATPYVAGVAALVKSLQPEISVADLRKHVVFSSERRAVLKGRTFSGGAVNAYRAVTRQFMKLDPEDPTYWVKFKEQSISVKGPKAQEKQIEIELSNPGANQMSFYLHRLKLFKNSKLQVFDKSERLLGEISGVINWQWSPLYKTDYLKLKLVFDLQSEPSQQSLFIRRTAWR